MTTGPNSLPQQYVDNQLLWEQAIDDGASTGDYTAADRHALQGRLALETMFQDLAETFSLEDQLATNYHEGLTQYILSKGYDNTYLVIANHQFHTQQALRQTQSQEERRRIQDASEGFLAANSDQLKRTMEIRREFTQILIDRSK